MTYAGLKSMIYAGLTRTIRASRLRGTGSRKNWTLDENPGMKLGDPRRRRAACSTTTTRSPAL
jgi:hypothetical protein